MFKKDTSTTAANSKIGCRKYDSLCVCAFNFRFISQNVASIAKISFIITRLFDSKQIMPKNESCISAIEEVTQINDLFFLYFTKFSFKHWKKVLFITAVIYH